jgi:hypothetical protein
MQDPLTHAIMNALSVVGSEEYLLPSDASGVGLALSLANMERGLYYPGGGYQRIQQALIQAIRVAGGDVLGEVAVDSIAVADDKNKVTGVNIKVNSEVQLIESSSIISGAGLLHTYTHLLRAAHVSDDTRAQLASLIESRPKVHIIYLIDASTVSADELGLRNADYLEVGSDYESMRWLLSKHLDKDLSTLSSSTASLKDSAIINPNYCRISCPSQQDHIWTSEESQSVGTSRVHVLVVEFEVGDAIVSLKAHRFAQPAKDTAAATATTVADGASSRPSSFSILNASPKLYVSNMSSTGGIGEISLSKNHRDRIIAAADCKLAAVYPKIFQHPDLPSTSSGKSFQKILVNPRIGGHRVANTPSKYGSKIASEASDINGLYFCGKDIASAGLMGDIQGAWAAANAVLGYSAAELILGRNITSDLESIPVKY